MNWEPPEIGKDVAEIKLSLQQKQNIAILSYGLAISGKSYEPRDIYNEWPVGKDKARYAGERPDVDRISLYMASEDYKDDMEERGIDVGENRGLSSQQIALISILTNISDTRALNAKLKAAGVKPAIYRGWLQNKEFNDMLRSISSDTLKSSIPIAEAQLAAQASAGDLRSIKYMFEVTGRHDPNKQQQVDSQALIAVIIDSIQQVVKDPEVLEQIQKTIAFNAQGVKGVIQQ